MKRTVLSCFLVAAVLALSLCPAGAWAEEPAAETAVAELEDKPDDAVKPPRKLGFFGKLFHGFSNIILAPLEVPATVARRTSEHPNPVWGVVIGSFEGIGYLVMREVAGLTEFLCAPLPPARYPLYDHPLGGPVFKEQPF